MQRWILQIALAKHCIKYCIIGPFPTLQIKLNRYFSLFGIASGIRVLEIKSLLVLGNLQTDKASLRSWKSHASPLSEAITHWWRRSNLIATKTSLGPLLQLPVRARERLGLITFELLLYRGTKSTFDVSWFCLQIPIWFANDRICPALGFAVLSSWRSTLQVCSDYETLLYF